MDGNAGYRKKSDWDGDGWSNIQCATIDKIEYMSLSLSLYEGYIDRSSWASVGELYFVLCSLMVVIACCMLQLLLLVGILGHCFLLGPKERNLHYLLAGRPELE